MASKTDFPIEFIIHAKIGDAILNNFVTRHIRELNISQESKHKIHIMFVTNESLLDWEPIIKPKFPNYMYSDAATKEHKDKAERRFKGDIIEAGIGFLYNNFGMIAAERYIQRNIIKQIKQML